jgi:hypothetical protein
MVSQSIIYGAIKLINKKKYILLMKISKIYTMK